MKIIIFSHDSDVDGMGSVVLSKIAFEDVTYALYPNVNALEIGFRNYITEKKLDEYDKIFVTDLALYDPALSMVANSNLKDKVLVFDHHKTGIDKGMNRYSFTKIVEEDSKGKRCGTELFYEYLVTNNLISNNNAISQFVEMTREEDTWEWKKNGEFGINAHNLSVLFNVLGREKYMDRMVDKLKKGNTNFEYNSEEIELIKKKKEEYNKILKGLFDAIECFVDEDGNDYGVVFANYEYRNEISEYIIDNGNPYDIKYLVIVAMDKGEYGQKSYRAIYPGFNVNTIAVRHGGGGHLTTAMVNITEEQKEKVLTLTRRDASKYIADSNYTL